MRRFHAVLLGVLCLIGFVTLQVFSQDQSPNIHNRIEKLERQVRVLQIMDSTMSEFMAQSAGAHKIAFEYESRLLAVEIKIDRLFALENAKADAFKKLTGLVQDNSDALLRLLKESESVKSLDESKAGS